MSAARSSCGCRNPECIHVCVERMRLAADEQRASDAVVDRARESLMMQRLNDQFAPGYTALRAALVTYDQSVQARRGCR